MAKSSKIRRSAQGQECTIRIPGVCNGNPETVVLCHLPGGGIGGKVSDIHGAYGCSACHSWIDGGWAHDKNCLAQWEPELYHLEAVIRTQEILLREGLIKV